VASLFSIALVWPLCWIVPRPSSLSKVSPAIAALAQTQRRRPCEQGGVSTVYLPCAFSPSPPLILFFPTRRRTLTHSLFVPHHSPLWKHAANHCVRHAIVHEWEAPGHDPMAPAWAQKVITLSDLAEPVGLHHVKVFVSTIILNVCASLM
jgi:hypothetical protein